MKKRMFIALDIADPDKAKLGHWRDQHLSLAFKTISEKNLHITLVFLGLIDDLQQAHLTQLINQQQEVIREKFPSALPQNQKQTLKLAQIGYFKRAQVLHIMPTTCPDWLTHLNHVMIKLCCNNNIAIENSVYQPHLSLYRKAKFTSRSTLTLLQKITVEQRLSITSFSLYHSYSTELDVVYEPVHSWKINF